MRSGENYPDDETRSEVPDGLRTSLLVVGLVAVFVSMLDFFTLKLGAWFFLLPGIWLSLANYFIATSRRPRVAAYRERIVDHGGLTASTTLFPALCVLVIASGFMGLVYVNNNPSS